MNSFVCDTWSRFEALDCTLQRLAAVEHSMLLDDQKVAERDPEARLDEILRETNPRKFWD